MTNFIKIRNYFRVLCRKRALNPKNTLSKIFAILFDYDEQVKNKYDKNIWNLSDYEESILTNLQRDGYCVIYNFWDSEKCNNAINEINRLIQDLPEAMSPHAFSDERIYGANRLSDLISDFASVKSFEKIASAYNGSSSIAAFTLGARIFVKEGGLGSGEGWHRDAMYRQFKSIIYLSDVGEENGPFQLLMHSNRPFNMLIDLITAGLDYMQYRISDKQVKKLLNKKNTRLITFTAPAGTVLLVDTAHIHRGKPILKDSRYALTNYYYPMEQIDDDLLSRFSVVKSD